MSIRLFQGNAARGFNVLDLNSEAPANQES